MVQNAAALFWEQVSLFLTTAEIFIWNRAHDDMFSKSSALPRHGLHRGKEERETVYVSVVEAAGGRLAEFSANDPRRLANLFSWGLEFTQTAWVVTPTAATERGEQAGSSMARRPSRDRSTLGPRPAIWFFFRSFSVFPIPASGAADLAPPLGGRPGAQTQVNFYHNRFAWQHQESQQHREESYNPTIIQQFAPRVWFSVPR